VTSGKRLVRLWASLVSFQRRKDAKDVKTSRLWKVGYLVSERRNTSFKDGQHLSKPCLSLSKDHLCIVTYLVEFKPDQGIGLANAASSTKSVIASSAPVSIRLARLHRLPSEAGHVRLRINLCFWVASVRTRPGLCLFRPYRWHRCGSVPVVVSFHTLIIFFSRHIHQSWPPSPPLFPLRSLRSPYCRAPYQ